jgi:hypothetical protein
VPLGQLGAPEPRLLGRGPQQLEDAHQLVLRRRAREERPPALRHLCETTAKYVALLQSLGDFAKTTWVVLFGKSVRMC